MRNSHYFSYIVVVYNSKAYITCNKFRYKNMVYGYLIYLLAYKAWMYGSDDSSEFLDTPTQI
jgi:hypothetical protein